VLGKERAASAGDWDGRQPGEIAEELKDLKGPLLPILHAFNERSALSAMRPSCWWQTCLNLTRAEVQGVVGFYHDFRRQPAGPM